MQEKSLEYYFDLITVLTKKEIKVRYKNSVLGYVWSIANPLLYAIIFYFVFKVIMRFQIKDYSLFLIAGLFPWQWINNSIMASTGSFISNVSLIKKVVFPRLFLPLAQVLNDAFHFVVSLPVIVAFLLFYGKYPSFDWLFLVPLMLIPTFLVVYGISLAVASINVFFRDLQYLVALLMMVLFYLTPVFYAIKFVPHKYRFLVFANPFTSIITGWRVVLMENRMDWNSYLIALVYGCVVFIVGVFVYEKLKDRFAEML